MYSTGLTKPPFSVLYCWISATEPIISVSEIFEFDLNFSSFFFWISWLLYEVDWCITGLHNGFWQILFFRLTPKSELRSKKTKRVKLFENNNVLPLKSSVKLYLSICNCCCWLAESCKWAGSRLETSYGEPAKAAKTPCSTTAIAAHLQYAAMVAVWILRLYVKDSYQEGLSWRQPWKKPIGW